MVRTQEQRDAQTVAIASALLMFVLGVGLVLGTAYVVGRAVPLPDDLGAPVTVLALLLGLLLGGRALRR